jgi:hypothetical protein
MGFFSLISIPPSQRRRTTTRCGLAKLQPVIDAAVCWTADTDEGRTRETHSLAGKSDVALQLIGHCPRRSKPVVMICADLP